MMLRIIVWNVRKAKIFCVCCLEWEKGKDFLSLLFRMGERQKFSKSAV